MAYLSTVFCNIFKVFRHKNSGLIAEERYRAYMKLKAVNAYNKNAVDYLAAKKRKFKQIAKLNKHNYKQ